MMKYKELYHKNLILNSVGRLILNFKNYPFQDYYKTCSLRKKNNIWDCEQISSEMNMYLADTSPDGALYGILFWIKKYAGISKKLNFYVEHGLYFGDLVRENAVNSIYDGVITFSKHRAKIINDKSDKKVFTIGPYVHYADDYYELEEFKKIKAKLGKTLLFFPPHSIKGHDAKYDISSIATRLKEFKTEYNTIMVCMYYKDVQRGLHKEFENENFFVVTAGHFYDYNFLSRLKSIIKLSDHTVSMAIGTHIGYCLQLDKSHEIINKDSSVTIPDDTNKLFSSIKESEIENRGSNYLKTFTEDEETILNAFFNMGSIITIEQQKISDKYWGLSEIKSKLDLKKELLGNDDGY